MGLVKEIKKGSGITALADTTPDPFAPFKFSHRSPRREVGYGTAGVRTHTIG